MPTKETTNSRLAKMLREAPGSRFTAREIAQWIFENYPDECQKKKEKSKNIANDSELIQQIVAEIGANRPSIERNWKQIKTTADRPRRYFWSDVTDEEVIKTAEASKAENVDNRISDGSNAESLLEKDLYPKLALYLKEEWGLYAKRIDEKTAGNKNGPGGNRWLFPDMVAMEDLTIGLSNEVKELHSHSYARKIRIWAFEVKKVLNRSNVREAFFQTVSNSSWANFGYLVATDIQSDETMKELQILSALHGVGLIVLDPSRPEDSDVRIPAKERVEIDWANADRLARENKDFKSVVTLVKEFHQTGNPRPNEWD